MEDRLTDLRNTLADLSAKHLATIPIKDSGYGRLDMYAVDGRVVIVRVYQLHKNYPASWDLFIPVSDSSRIDETLAALRAWAQPAAPQEGRQDCLTAAGMEAARAAARSLIAEMEQPAAPQEGQQTAEVAADTDSPEALLEAAQEAQTAYWEALHDLEAALGDIEIDGTRDLQGLTLDDLAEDDDSDEDEEPHEDTPSLEDEGKTLGSYNT